VRDILKEIEMLSAKAQTFLASAGQLLSTGDYNSCASRCYYAIYDKRIVGDYGVTISVAQDEAEHLLEAAQDFVGKVKDYLDRWTKQSEEHK
jgi:uncharacterized protein (UPF0332 family)